MTRIAITKPKINVIVKEPSKAAELREIGTSLEDYQEIVCGSIESIPFPDMDDVDIILNDMGKLNGMKGNIIVPEYGDILMGPIIIIGVDEKECTWKSLPEKKIPEILKYINSNDIKQYNK